MDANRVIDFIAGATLGMLIAAAMILPWACESQHTMYLCLDGQIAQVEGTQRVLTGRPCVAEREHNK